MSYSAQKAGWEGEEGPSRGGRSQGHGGGEAGADEEEREGERREADAHTGESTKLEHTFRNIQKTYSI